MFEKNIFKGCGCFYSKSVFKLYFSPNGVPEIRLVSFSMLNIGLIVLLLRHPHFCLCTCFLEAIIPFRMLSAGSVMYLFPLPVAFLLQEVPLLRQGCTYLLF
jgi:hypothetical protein